MKLDYQSNIEDYNFDKKIVKIFKALNLMEQAKHSEHKFSKSFH
jgi:hypothetical protein